VRSVIEEPAQLVGLEFEEGLVDELVKDVVGEPAGLPLLQFTLLKLWEARRRNRITFEAYSHLGRAREALARCADEFYNGLVPQEQVTVRRILLRLVRPGEGMDVDSNRLPVSSLYRIGYREPIDRALQKLEQARLLRRSRGEKPDEDQVQVAHEAMIRNWPRLVEWLVEERATMRARLRLTAAAEQWMAYRRDPAGLLRGPMLEQAEQFEDLSDLETEFLRASQANRRRANRGMLLATVAMAVLSLALLVVAGLARRSADLAEKRSNSLRKVIGNLRVWQDYMINKLPEEARGEAFDEAQKTMTAKFGRPFMAILERNKSLRKDLFDPVYDKTFLIFSDKAILAAINYYDKILEANPDLYELEAARAELFSNLGTVQRDKGENDDALRSFSRAVEYQRQVVKQAERAKDRDLQKYQNALTEYLKEERDLDQSADAGKAAPGRSQQRPAGSDDRAGRH
jgi:tetratricopeptide (TPR) repeat protein